MSMLRSGTQALSKGVHRPAEESVDICSPDYAGVRISSLVRAHYLD